MKRDLYRTRVETFWRQYGYLFLPRASFVPDYLQHGELNLHALPIEPGWFDMIEGLFLRFDAALDDVGRDYVRVSTIGQKFGHLDLRLNRWVLRRERKRRVPKVLLDAAYWKPLEQLVSDIESRTGEVCSFCGSAGHVRDDREWHIALCDRHAPYNDEHLICAFEQMTEPRAEVTPPDREHIVAGLRAAAERLQSVGIRRLGVVPPVGRGAPWGAIVPVSTPERTRLERLMAMSAGWPCEILDGDLRSMNARDVPQIDWIDL